MPRKMAVSTIDCVQYQSNKYDKIANFQIAYSMHWLPFHFLFSHSIAGGGQTNETIRNRTPLSTRRSKRMVSAESSTTLSGTVSPPTLPSTPITPTTSTMATTTTTTTKASPAVKSKKSPAMSLRERRFKRREATKNSNDGGVAATKAINLNPDTEANQSIAHNNNNQNHDGASSSQNTRSDIELSNGVAVALQTDTTPIKNRSTAIENCRQNLSAKICDLTKRNDDFIRDANDAAAAAAAAAKNANATPKLNGIVKLPANGLMPRRSRKGIPHKLDLLDMTNDYDDSDIESSCDGSGVSAGDAIETKLPPPVVSSTQKPATNGTANGSTTTMSRKRKISKSVSESESTSSWENKAPPEAQCLTAKNGVSSGIVLQPEHVLLKTPERRLKLTLRMKRSPMLDDLIESGTNLSDGSGNSAYTANTHYAPEYEVFRVEGLLDNTDDESSFDASPTTAKLHQQKRKKRHKTKAKSHRHRHRKQSQQHRQYDLEQTSSEDQLQSNTHSHLNNHTHSKNCSHEQAASATAPSPPQKPNMLYGHNGDKKIHNNHIRHLNNSNSNCTSDHCKSALLPKSSSTSTSSSSPSSSSSNSSHTQPMKRLRLIFGNETHTIDIPPITAQSPNTTTSTTRLIPT